MNDRDIIFFFPFLVFFLFFIGLFLVLPLLIGLMSGWFTLQKRYPNNQEPALLTLRGRSGTMGTGVALNGALKLSACASGLRIAMWGINLFQRPFLVPWGEITADPKTSFFLPMARLTLGHPPVGHITIDPLSWQRLSAHSPGKARNDDQFEPVSGGQVAQALVFQWVLISAGIAIFFAVASQLSLHTEPFPMVILAFPVIAIGIVQLICYIRIIL
jgi:hypothetical protein